MAGEVRLVIALSSFFFFSVAAAVFAGDDSPASAQSSSTAPAPLPQTPVKAVADMFHGTKVVDNYRWLEDGKSPATQKWVEEEMAYTHSVLDRLPGREAIHARLTQLLSIGSVTPPMIAGRHYFYTKREGMAGTSPSFMCAKWLNDGEDRVLVDATTSSRLMERLRSTGFSPARMGSMWRMELLRAGRR